MKTPQQAQEARNIPKPAGAVQVTIPKERVFTPFDILNPDGTMKKPAE